jgi:hypothetical protein
LVRERAHVDPNPPGARGATHRIGDLGHLREGTSTRVHNPA